MPSLGKPLIIAEKPSAARAIADALGGFKSHEGYMESREFYLSWAIGHLVELMAPEEYDSRWKRWALESLPMLPSMFGLKVAPKTRSQFSIVARLAGQAPELVNACDAAREGELIFRYICDAARVKKPVRRLWVSSLTREAIRKAFADLRPDQEYDRLYQSALCRAQGDWLMGMNATRAFTVKWGELLSVGRVQTPTLALLVRREREINAFVPEDYWEVWADFATADSRKYRGKYLTPAGADRLKAAADAEAVAGRVKGQPGTVESAEEKPASEKPPQLYDLTTLQRDANRRFGLTAAATLKAAQGLYEAKLITYPRTDSRYLNRDLVKMLPGVVAGLRTLPEFSAAAAGADLKLVHAGNRRVVDDAKVSDHHAIIPTAEMPAGLSGVEGKIYGLIARRFLAQFYPEARYLDTEVITRVGGQPDRFRSRGRRVVDPGWKAVEPEAPKSKDEAGEEEATLPGLTPGEGVQTKKVTVEKKETQPPKRYTEASLLGAMESAGKAMDDEALREAMKGHGLGTPATRASIIERLKDVGYIALEKKALVPTEKGHRLVALAEAAGAQVLLSPELTGEWEKRIADIQAGAYQPDRFQQEIRQLATQVVELVKGAKATGPAPAKSVGAKAAGRATAADTDGAPAPKRRTASKKSAPNEAGADALPATAGKCPRCGRAVIRGGRDWKCVGDCTFRMPTWLCGKAIDGSLAGTIMQKGRSPLIEGFKSPRTGKTFSAFLVLKQGEVAFEFPPDKPKKASGYRRSGEEQQSEHSTTTKARSRKTGSSSTGRSAGGGTGRSRVGGRSSGSSESPGTGPRGS